MINSGMLPDPPPSERLESWKEIAAYLKKGVRTVQRWERTDGLPVRRLGHDRTGIVFAYKAELDAWWMEQSRRASPRPEPKVAGPSGNGASRRQTAAIFSLLALVVSACLWAVIAWNARHTTPVVYRRIPLTSDHGWASQPSFSPDGQRIAYSWTPPGGRSSIQVKSTAGEPAVRLTSGVQSEFNPSWSPDGRSIAFLRSLRPKPGFALMLTPAHGGQETLLAELSRASGGLSWSADGQWLIATDGPPKARSIVAISVANGSKHPLTRPYEFGYIGVTLSPDSSRLIFGDPAPGASPIYELALGAGITPRGEPRPITNKLFARDLTVSFAANEVVYTDGSWEEGFELWRLRLTPSAQPERIYAATDRCITPALSRDGRRLAFAVNRIHREEIWRKSLSDPDAPPERLLSSTHSDLNPQYSPDGRHIAFHSTRSGASDIWVADSDGTDPRRLTFTNARTTATPRWSPDGQWIAFESNQTGQSEIYTIASAGGSVRRLTDNPAVDAIPSWSRDGRSLYFCSNRTGRFEVWKMPAGGGRPTQVTFNGGFSTVEAPDGKYLYYSQTRNYGPVIREPLSGGAAEVVIPNINGLFYAVAPGGIYFQSERTISFWDSSTGRIREILTTPKPLSLGMAASPDSRFLLFTQIETDGSDLYMIDGLR
jgi:Tol biopolymer transport system component